MADISLKTTAKCHPVTVGTGLLTLDWLLEGDRVRPTEAYAGGSCGNVLAILAFLGCQSYPVARLGRSHHTRQVLSDLRRWNVDTSFIRSAKTGITPLIIVRIREDSKGKMKHRYEWRHPASGAWLPRYRPLPKGVATKFSKHLPLATVFYFDRAEPAALVLAKVMRERGAIVFFEPSGIGDSSVFADCLAIADVVKYSAERLPIPPVSPKCFSPKLEIQTLGEQGLRYRIKLKNDSPTKWRHLAALPAAKFRDASGCGDWCSAGIIYSLCAQDREFFLSLKETAIQEGIRFGQALASVNCSYSGARGPMYQMKQTEVLNSACQMIEDSERNILCR